MASNILVQKGVTTFSFSFWGGERNWIQYVMRDSIYGLRRDILVNGVRLTVRLISGLCFVF